MPTPIDTVRLHETPKGVDLALRVAGPAHRAPSECTRCRDPRRRCGVLPVFAAVIEGFWSAGPAPTALKYGVVALGWVLVLVYLALAGRAGADAP